MNIQLAVSGKRNTDKNDFLSWLVTTLTEMGADVTVLTGDSISVVADKGFMRPVPTAMNAEVAPTPSALQEAHQVIYGDREKTYGDPGKNCRTIATYWNTHIKAAKSMDVGLTENDVCGMMILLKQARLANSPTHRDSLVDIAGYVGLQDRIQQQADSNQLQKKYPHQE